MSRARPRPIAAALCLLAATALAQLRPQDADEHSALADVDGTAVRDDDLAAAFRPILVKNDAAAAKGAMFLFQGCFGGGMIDDLEAQLKEVLPGVAGAASEHDGFAWFQQTQAEAGAAATKLDQQRLDRAEAALTAFKTRREALEDLPGPHHPLVKAEIKWLGSAIQFTNKFIKQMKKRIADLKKVPQSLNVDKKPHGHWTRPLLEELKVANQALLVSITNARDKDKVGVKGKPKLEKGQSLHKAKGDAIVLKGTARKLYAVLWAGKTNLTAFFDDVDEMRAVLAKEWGNRVEFVILFGDGATKVLGTKNKLPWPALKATRANLLAELGKLKDKVTKDDLLLFYASNHSMTAHDQPGVQLGAAAQPFRHGFSLTPAQLDGMNASSDVTATVTVHQVGVSSPSVTVRVNGIVLGNLEPFDEFATFTVPEYLLTNCNVVELQSAEDGEDFDYAASAGFGTGPVAPVGVDGYVESEVETCPPVPLLAPFDVARTVGASHDLTMQVFDEDGLPVTGSTVVFEVIDGPNAGVTGGGTTDASGQVTFAYVGEGGPGVDVIRAAYEDENDDDRLSNRVTVTWSAAPSPVHCTFETDGDAEPELDLVDADGNGFCEFPDLKTHLYGDLVFSPATPVEFHGTTIVESDRIVIEEGAKVTGGAGSLRSLMLIATDGDLVSRGTLTLSASDDLLLRSSAGGIDLGGSPTLAAADQLTIDARAGAVRIAPAAGVQANAFTALGGNLLAVTAKSGRGGIEVVGGSLASRQVVLDATANTSPIAPKGVLLDGALLTSDPADLTLRSSPSTVSVKASAGTGAPGGAILLRNATRLASGSNLLLGTKATGEGACLSGTVTLAAKGGAGYVDLTQIRGSVVDDGTTIVQGVLKGTIASGTCP
jgi:hypothetical protein